MSRRQQARLLRTIAVMEWLLFLAAAAAITVVIVRLRVDAFGLLAWIALLALFLIRQFECAVRRETLTPAADREAAA